MKNSVEQWILRSNWFDLHIDLLFIDLYFMAKIVMFKISIYILEEPFALYLLLNKNTKRNWKFMNTITLKHPLVG